MNAQQAPWRVLTCVRCRQPIQVLELPHIYLEPARYVCGGCLKEKR